jgi:hypothetical protein
VLAVLPWETALDLPSEHWFLVSSFSSYMFVFSFDHRSPVSSIDHGTNAGTLQGMMMDLHPLQGMLGVSSLL